MTPLLYLEIDLYLSFSLNTFLSSKIFWKGIIFPTYLLYIFLKYENEKFVLGKAKQIGTGNDATIFATGVCVPEAIKAKEILEKKGIFVRVVDIHTIKPIDKQTIIKCAKETNRIITVEDHSIIGGLGSSICEVLSEEYPCKVTRLGVKDCFGKSGNGAELMKYFGIDYEAIVKLFN